MRINRKTTLAIGMMSLLVLSGCSSNQAEWQSQNQGSESVSENSDTGNSSESSEEAEETSQDVDASTVTSFTGDYSKTALDGEWSVNDSVQIELKESTVQTSGSGVEINGGLITITKGGTYVFSGTLNDGRIYVNASEDENVQIVLNGADITCSNYAAIVIKEAKNCFLTLAEGTTNTITDGTEYSNVTEDELEPTAAIFSKTDLIINGTGSLNVNANYVDGITSKDDLEIISGQLVITAVDDGIVGKDSISVLNPEITIHCEGDGMKSTNSEDTTKGYVVIDGGTLHITSGNDGIQAESQLVVNDGQITIITDGGSANASTTKSGDVNEAWGNRGGFFMNGNSESTTTTETDSSSAKALKAGASIGIFAGTLEIDSSDDSIHSNGAVRIAGGNLTIASGDDGIHADSELQIDAGTIVITKSYEGIESQDITVNGGNISIVASDDGVNVSGGNDGSSVNGRPGQNMFVSSLASGVLSINGGEIVVDTTGDGLDSNGSIEMTGGTVTVYGPTDNGNGALDYDATFNLTGGVLLIAGSSGMAQVPSSTSTQGFVAAGLNSSLPGGTKVTVTDSNGTVVATMTPTKTFSMVCIANDSILTSETYTITAGSQSITVEGGSSTNLSGGMGGMMGGGMGGGRGGKVW